MSISHIMEVYGHHLKEHAQSKFQVQIKYLMTR